MTLWAIVWPCTKNRRVRYSSSSSTPKAVPVKWLIISLLALKPRRCTDISLTHVTEENIARLYLPGRVKADSHITCRAHAVPLPRRAAKGLECVFPIWFTQCGRVWFTLATPCPCRAHAMLWPCRSSQGHGIARLSRDFLWATCPRSFSSGYHTEFHEDCYQKHTNPPHNDPYLRLSRVVVAHYRKDDLLNCWTSSSDISGYHADFHEGHGTVGAG
jgi:hypothetical protein